MRRIPSLRDRDAFQGAAAHWPPRSPASSSRRALRCRPAPTYPAPPDEPFPSLYSELDALVRDAGFTSYQAIVAATRNGARAAGVSSRYGGLEPGKYADIVLVRRNPLDDIDNLRSIVLTVKRGVRYLRAGYHFTLIKGAEP